MASADEVSPLIAKSETDIAAVPANLASVLYNKTGGAVHVIAINTLGVLYVCELGDTVSTVSDLRGRTIYSAGKGATPQYALEYVLTQAGLDPAADVTIEWKSEHAECVAALAEDPGAIAMLPQPFVTTAQMKNDKIRVALDLNREWESACEASGQKARLITGVAVVRSLPTPTPRPSTRSSTTTASPWTTSTLTWRRQPRSWVPLTSCPRPWPPVRFPPATSPSWRAPT